MQPNEKPLTEAEKEIAIAMQAGWRFHKDDSPEGYHFTAPWDNGKGPGRSYPRPIPPAPLAAYDNLGANSWMAKKYGRLIGDWETELRGGFAECWRVLKVNGTLIFKWNSTRVPLAQVLALAPVRPLFGHTTGRQSKTHWCTFFKASTPPLSQLESVKEGQRER